jgi:hypothetical protein
MISRKIADDLGLGQAFESIMSKCDMFMELLEEERLPIEPRKLDDRARK